MMNHEFAHVIGGSRWLMEPRAFRAMVKRAETATAEAIQAAVASYASREPVLRMLGDVAVIHMCGLITHRNTWFSMYFGGATIEDMQAQFRMALRDDAVKTIAFRCDTPGGTADMVPEFADEIYASRGQKPIIALADTDICSAGIWLAAQADQIHVSTSSHVGSVGVYHQHEEFSGMLDQAGVKVTLIKYGVHKTEGNVYEPLSDEAKASIQARVDEIGVEFDTAMARGRRVSRKVVEEKFGQGKVFRGKEAIKAGLADKTGTFAQVLGKLTKGRGMVLTSKPLVTSLTLEVGVPDEPEADASAPVASSAQSVCKCCGKSSCPCMQAECAVGCESCSDVCRCKADGSTPAAQATATEDVDDIARQAAIRDEHHRILAALSAD